MLHIDITSKSLQEMIELYKLNEKQKVQLAELQKEEYNSMWTYMLSGSSGGSNDIVEVAKQYIGNVGGQPFGVGMGLIIELNGVLVLLVFVLMSVDISRLA